MQETAKLVEHDEDDEEAAAVASFNKCLLSRRRELRFQGNGKFFLETIRSEPPLCRSSVSVDGAAHHN